MILILSSASDISTSEVETWLIHYRANYIRLNGEEGLSDFFLSLNKDKQECFFNYYKQPINLNNISAFWYRRNNFAIQTEINIENNLSDFFRTEYWTVTDFLNKTLEGKPSIGSFEKEKFTNKLLLLSTAIQVGLDVPKTLVTSQKKDVIDFITQQPTITKALNINFSTVQDGFYYSVNSTKEVNLQHIENMSHTFSLSLLQEKLDKAYELRIFYQNNVFFTMAIFSQLDKQTTLDFRNYNKEKPNRCVPYNLPYDISNKLEN